MTAITPGGYRLGLDIASAGLLAVDWLIDSNGTPHLLECNDNPGGLQTIDAFPRSCLKQSSLDSLASYCASKLGCDGRLYVAVPDRYRLSAEATSSFPLSHDANALTADIIGFSRAAEHIGLAAILVDLETWPKLTFSEGDVVWNKSRLLAEAVAHGDYPEVLVTSPNVIAACRDKSSYGLLNAQLLESRVPRSINIDDLSRSSLDYARRNLESHTGKWIAKPRFGYGGIGIFRFDDSLALPCDPYFTWTSEFFLHAGGYLVQPWLEPTTVSVHGRHFCSDLRIIVVDGSVTAGCIRRAVAPRDEPASTLSWLTSLGEMDSLGLLQTPESAAALTTIICESSHVARAISEIASALEPSSLLRQPNPFHTAAATGVQRLPISRPAISGGLS